MRVARIAVATVASPILIAVAWPRCAAYIPAEWSVGTMLLYTVGWLVLGYLLTTYARIVGAWVDG